MDLLLIACIIVAAVGLVQATYRASAEWKAAANRTSPLMERVAVVSKVVALHVLAVSVSSAVLLSGAVFLGNVTTVYTPSEHVISVNEVTNDKGQTVVERKHIQSCSVKVERATPLFVGAGTVTRVLNYRYPCDGLLPEHKTEISASIAFLSRDKK